MFNEQAEIKTQLLFDRLRLVFLLKDDLDVIKQLSSFNKVVLKAIEFEDDIV